MTIAVKEKSKFCLFVRREIDNYGLDPYKFWIYTWRTHRASNGEAWESRMGLSRARKPMQILNLAEITQ